MKMFDLRACVTNDPFKLRFRVCTPSESKSSREYGFFHGQRHAFVTCMKVYTTSKKHTFYRYRHHTRVPYIYIYIVTVIICGPQN